MNTTKARIRALAAAVAFSWCCDRVPASPLDLKPDVLEFVGAPLDDAVSGIRVNPQNDDGVITVSCDKHGYILTLPYSESWRFWFPTGSVIEGEDDRYHFNLKAVAELGTTDAAYLRQVRANLSRQTHYRSLEWLDVEGQPVLKTVSHFSPNGLAMPDLISYIVTTSSKDKRLRLILFDQEEQLDQRVLRSIVRILPAPVLSSP